MDKTTQIEQLSQSIAPRTLHQFKSFNTQYVQWCRQNKLVDQTEIEYGTLPLSAILVHWFLLDTVITQTSASSGSVELLQSYITSFSFLEKICKIYGNEQPSLNTTYLEKVLDTHRYWEQQDEVPTFPALSVISFNTWNPSTSHLKKTHFKTSLEKFRFLVDFHLASYQKLTHSERSQMKLHMLKVEDMNKLRILYHNGDNQPIHILPQNSPFLCPFTSLATYLFFRFYGATSSSKGDGFPSLFNDTTTQSLSVAKGRLATEYPKDTTMNLAYTSMFKYCNLPYKRRQYFDQTWGKDALKVRFMEYEESDMEFFSNFNETFPEAAKTPNDSAFVDNVPFDFGMVLNMHSPYQAYDSFTVNDYFKSRGQLKPPESIVFQFFPEIEFYKQKKNFTKLSNEAKDILRLIEMIRLVFVANLPIIHDMFPEHNLFENDVFTNSDVESYLNDTVFKTNSNTNSILPFKKFQNLSNEQLLKQLIEVPVSTSQVPVQSATISDGMFDEFRNQNFQFVQFQTLSNFKTLIAFLSKIFDSIAVKKSSKEIINKQLLLLNDAILERINNSTPKDIKDYFLKKELLNHKKSQLIEYEDEESVHPESNETSLIIPSQRLHEVSDSESSDDDFDSSSDESDNASLQNELRVMVDEFVSSKIDQVVTQQLQTFEGKLDYMVEALVDEKIERKLASIDFEKYLPKRRRPELDLSYSSDITPPPPKLPRTEPSTYRKIIEDSRFTIRGGETSPSSMASFKNHESTPKLASRKATTNINQSTPKLSPEKSTFTMNPDIDNIDDIIYEWFTPNPEMDNECVHSMNKAHDKSWRSGFETLYKQRKQIVELYVYMINTLKLDRYKAIEICKELQTTEDFSIKDFSKHLKTWKKQHNGTFEGIVPGE